MALINLTITERDGTQRQLGSDRPVITIGRVRENDVVLDKTSVSKKHAQVALEDGRWMLSDLQSTNGVLVNGRRLTAPHRLATTDRVIIGDYMLTFEFAQPGAPAADPAPRERISVARTRADSDISVPSVSQSGSSRAASSSTGARTNPGEIFRTNPGTQRIKRPTFVGEAVATDGMTESGEVVLRARGATVRAASTRRVADLLNPAELRPLAQRVINELLVTAGVQPLPLSYPPTTDDLRRYADIVRMHVEESGSSFPGAVVRSPGFVPSLVDELIGLGPLESMIDDDSVSEADVSIAGASYITRDGTRSLCPVGFASPVTAAAIAERVARLQPAGVTAIAIAPGVTLRSVPIASRGTATFVVRRSSAEAAARAGLLRADGAWGTVKADVMRALRNGHGVFVVSQTASAANAVLADLVAAVDGDRRTVAVDPDGALAPTPPSAISLVGFDAIASYRSAVSLSPDLVVVGGLDAPLLDAVLAYPLPARSGLVMTTAVGTPALLAMQLSAWTSNSLARSRMAAATLPLVIAVDGAGGGCRVRSIDELVVREDGKVDVARLLDIQTSDMGTRVVRTPRGEETLARVAG